MCSGVEEHVCHSFVTTSSEKATLLMQPSVGAHLVSWFLSNRDTNITNKRLAALWVGGQLHLFIKEEFLYGLCQELNLCHSEETSGQFTKRVFNMESEQTVTLYSRAIMALYRNCLKEMLFSSEVLLVLSIGSMSHYFDRF